MFLHTLCIQWFVKSTTNILIADDQFLDVTMTMIMISTFNMDNSTGQYALSMHTFPQINITTTNNKETWTIVLKCFQLVPALLGFIANIITLVTLKNGNILSTAILILLKHQSFVDAMVCGLAIPIFIQPPMWITGVKSLDIVICYLWHSQLFFWYFVGVSAWNLVYIAMERFVVVNKPLRHTQLTQKILCRLFVLSYVFYFIPNIIVATWVYFDNSKCVYQSIFNPKVGKIMSVTLITLLAVAMYFVPVGLLISLYSRTLHELQLRQNESLFQNTTTVSNASKQLLQTACIVSICFIIFMFFDLIYYFLDVIGVVKAYVLNSPLQITSVFFTSLNSSINPFVYAYSMPVFRRSVRNTLVCKKDSKQRHISSNQLV